MSMRGEEAVVWVAFVTINAGDHDQFTDFLSVHSTREKAENAVAEWVGRDNADCDDENGERFLRTSVTWVNDPNTQDAYLIGNSTANADALCAGEAEVFGSAQQLPIDPVAE